MTERTESNPLTKEVIAHLRTIAGRGPVRLDDLRHGAVHGTSVETLLLAKNSGVIIGYSHDKPLGQYRRGDLSVYPTPQLINKIDHLTDPSIREQLVEYPNEAITYAKTYAERAAQRHALLTNLGIPISDQTAEIQALRLIEGEGGHPRTTAYTRGYFLKTYSHEVLEAALQKALLRKGFLLGISPEITTTPSITLQEGDRGSSDIRITTNGHGLPYLLISGIEPLGPIEEEFLNNLS